MLGMLIDLFNIILDSEIHPQHAFNFYIFNSPKVTKLWYLDGLDFIFEKKCIYSFEKLDINNYKLFYFLILF